MDSEKNRLSAGEVRWRCEPHTLGFSSTDEIPEDQRFFGQEEAIAALRYGLATRNHGHNIFVRGISGIGRTSLVRRMVEEYQPQCLPVPDRCYVHHFSSPEKARLISLPRGQGKHFQAAMERFADFIERELQATLSSDRIKSREKILEEKAHAEMRRLGKPLEEELGREGLALLPMQIGANVVPAIVPVIDKKAVT
ncbi:MAG: AAA family ATPase, partial [Gammaproteobacteria bacterium]|nr:AAA family ATPase [Gammaproteobacteria bacterium]